MRCIIDGDVVAYMSCASRFATTTGHTLITLPGQEPQFTPEQDAMYLERAWIRAQEIVNELIEVCFADNVKIAVKGEGNFREDIYPDYKQHRRNETKSRNVFVPQLRARLVEKGLAEFAHGMEADDYLRMWQQQAVQENEPYVICSIDKDLRCIPGRHYNMKKNTFSEVSEAEATRFFYEQLLQGDPTDNIKGIPKVGPIKAQQFLKDFDTETEFQTIVQQCYQAAFGINWKKELELNGRLLYLLKHPKDVFTIDGWPEVIYEPTAEELTLQLDLQTNEATNDNTQTENTNS
jgi:5'-3' exonuclease